MKIESIKIKNFRVFKDVTIKNIPRLSVFLGANGTGKSTLFDVFGFLKDALASNVSTAINKRGGYHEVLSRNTSGPIEFEFKFRSDDNGPLVTYELKVGKVAFGPVVQSEVLKYRRGSKGQPWHFLNFKNGEGYAIVNEDDYGKADAKPQRDFQTLDKANILAIKGLGQFQKFRQVLEFRKMIENWEVSDFHISAARSIPEARVSEHLSTTGENLAQVAKYIKEEHPELFKDILRKMSERVPGVSNVSAETTVDGRIALRFSDGSFVDPFLAQHASDGTIKMFAYLLLLSDPQPHPLLCVEEPENQLHHELMAILCDEFRDYANRGGQVFVSTHSPDFVNGLYPEELFWLTKRDGYTTIHRAKDSKLITDLCKDGDQLGYLWKQGFFDGAGVQ